MEIHFGRSESYERVVLKNEDYREDYMVYVGGVEEWKETYEGERELSHTMVPHSSNIKTWPLRLVADSSQLQKLNFTLHTISGLMNERYAHKRRFPLTTYEWLKYKGEDYLYRDMKQKGWNGRMEEWKKKRQSSTHQHSCVWLLLGISTAIEKDTHALLICFLTHANALAQVISKHSILITIFEQ